MANSTTLKTLLRTAAGIAGIGVTAAAVYYTARLGTRERADPARCGAGLLATGPRCCARGQHLTGGRCSGQPLACPQGMTLSRDGTGCVASPARADLPGGTLTLNPQDWQAEGIVQARTERVRPFALDLAEVTFERWGHCERAGGCPAMRGAEPGLPVTGVDAKDAERFCRFAGGRLPTSAEWLFASMGPEGRRFPWGGAGLVCRRAVFGLVKGPCAKGGGPEIAGSRPDGASPEGLLDLSGNVAEWTAEPDGRPVARGGSYRSESAAELTGWASDTPPHAEPWIGFRCAYDPASAQHP